MRRTNERTKKEAQIQFQRRTCLRERCPNHLHRSKYMCISFSFRILCVFSLCAGLFCSFGRLSVGARPEVAIKMCYEKGKKSWFASHVIHPCSHQLTQLTTNIDRKHSFLLLSPVIPVGRVNTRVYCSITSISEFNPNRKAKIFSEIDLIMSRFGQSGN